MMHALLAKHYPYISIDVFMNEMDMDEVGQKFGAITAGMNEKESKYWYDKVCPQRAGYIPDSVRKFANVKGK